MCTDNTKIQPLERAPLAQAAKMPLRTLAHTQGHGLAGRRRPRPLVEVSDSFMNTPRRLKNAHIRKKLLTMDITDYAVIDAMTLPELRVALKQRRIDTEGNKSTLVRRMKELASEQPAQLQIDRAPLAITVSESDDEHCDGGWGDLLPAPGPMSSGGSPEGFRSKLSPPADCSCSPGSQSNSDTDRTMTFREIFEADLHSASKGDPEETGAFFVRGPIGCDSDGNGEDPQPQADVLPQTPGNAARTERRRMALRGGAFRVGAGAVFRGSEQCLPQSLPQVGSGADHASPPASLTPNTEAEGPDLEDGPSVRMMDRVNLVLALLVIVALLTQLLVPIGALHDSFARATATGDAPLLLSSSKVNKSVIIIRSNGEQSQQESSGSTSRDTTVGGTSARETGRFATHMERELLQVRYERDRFRADLQQLAHEATLLRQTLARYEGQGSSQTAANVTTTTTFSTVASEPAVLLSAKDAQSATARNDNTDFVTATPDDGKMGEVYYRCTMKARLKASDSMDSETVGAIERGTRVRFVATRVTAAGKLRVQVAAAERLAGQSVGGDILGWASVVASDGRVLFVKV